MNHYLATYIDLIQSIGFIFILFLVITVLKKLFSDNKKDNIVEVVNIRVDK